jgi:hypothetical protein
MSPARRSRLAASSLMRSRRAPRGGAAHQIDGPLILDEAMPGLRGILAVGALAAVVTGCGAAAGPMPSASVTTAVQGWEHYFRLDWTPNRRPGGTDIDGYIYNDHGAPAGSVRLLAQALDADNNVVAQKIEWVPGVVPNFGRSYFRIPGLPPAPLYRVTVWSFDIIDTPDGLFRRF